VNDALELLSAEAQARRTAQRVAETHAKIRR
jgi:hypothetical protein